MKKRTGKLARRYSKALLNTLVRDKANGGVGKVNDIARALEEFEKLFRENRELQTALLSPMFDREQRKKALLGVTAAAKLPEELSRFLALVFERDRLSLLTEMTIAFRELADEVAKVIQVEVFTAREVSEREQKDTERSLSGSISGSLVFHWSVDPSLIGGMVIRYSGKVVDGSVRGRLENIEHDLTIST